MFLEHRKLVYLEILQKRAQLLLRFANNENLDKKRSLQEGKGQIKNPPHLLISRGSILIDLGSFGKSIRAIVVTHYGVAATYMISLAATNLISSGIFPTIAEISPMNRSLFEGFLERRGFSRSDYDIIQGLPRFAKYPLLIYSVGYDLRPNISELERLSHQITLVVTHVGKSLRLVLKSGIYELKRVEGDIFLLEDGWTKERKYLEINNFEVKFVNYRERKSEREALKVLLDAMSEQGELSTKDAIFVLQGKLNISKEEARRMLYGLAQSGKLRLLHGKVELS